MKMKFGRLQEVDVRELWRHEQYNFSPWLAKEENIELLNDILGLTLVDIDKEVYVGSYKCDLVAKDETDGTKVIIENQLERSDHDHLGKIITYASGLNATVVVWIVNEAREEHRSAIEWLNNNTNKDLNFFLIELHAYKIGDSLPAPKFEVIEKPNEFIKTGGGGSGGSSNMNKSESKRLEFWTMFNEIVTDKGKPFAIRKAGADHWYDVVIGKTGVHISITLVSREGKIGIELYIVDNKKLFDDLHIQKQEIEKELGFNLDWQSKDGKKASRILYKFDGLNFDDQSNYRELMEKIIDYVIKMRSVFSNYVEQALSNNSTEE
jgi:hypothetical protein